MANAKRAPRISLVLAAHGDRGGDDPNRSLDGHAAALSLSQRFSFVGLGLLKGEPSLEHALHAAAGSGGEVVVYPFLMAGGFFADKVLVRRVQEAGFEHRCRILAPLGSDPALPGLIADAACGRARAAGLAPETSTLLMVGHGSKLGPASRLATEAAAQAIRGLAAFASVATAFIEEPPRVADALSVLDGPVVVLGFLSGDGLHAGEDIPAAIAASGRCALYAGSAGTLPGLPALIEAAAFGGAAPSPPGLPGMAI